MAGAGCETDLSAHPIFWRSGALRSVAKVSAPSKLFCNERMFYRANNVQLSVAE